VILLAWIGAAAAWEDIGAVWEPSAFPIPYTIAEALGGGLDEDEAVAAIQAAFQTWEDAGCGVSFAYQGRDSGEGFGGIDGVSVVYFIESGWPEEPTLLSVPAIAVDGATIVEADLAFNGEHFSWSVDGDGVSHFDLQGSVTHEVGHLLGLWHTTDPDASLNDFLNGKPEARTLGDDDIEGLCALYSASAGGQLGEDCEAAADCAAGLICLDDGAARYCSTACQEDAECPEGFACYDLGGGEQACAIDLDDKGCEGCGQAAPAHAPGGLLGLWWGVGVVLVRRRL